MIQQANHDDEEIECLIFYADPLNSAYLHTTQTSEIASIIIKATGSSGHNLDYLLRLIDVITRDFPPTALDQHLVALQRACMRQLTRHHRDDVIPHPCLESVTGSNHQDSS